MYRSFCIFLLLIIATIDASSLHTDEKCPFKDTVDLRNQTRLEDGSYIYKGINIPADRWGFYNYELKYRNKSRKAPLHVRGCLCDAKRKIFCLKLCCEQGLFFNDTSKRCHKIPEHLNMPVDLTLRTGNKVNIFQHFVNQVGIPCRRAEVFTPKDKWHMQEDGILYVKNGEHDEALLDTVSYCMTPYHSNGTRENVLMPVSCPMKIEPTASDLLNTYSMAISVFFLIPTILVYFLVKELRRNLRGKLLICYLIAMAIAYGIISFINITRMKFTRHECRSLGFTGYYFFISVFLWLSVLCYDISINFREVNMDVDARQNMIRFIIYSLYVWGCAGLLTGIVIWCQLSDAVEDYLKPGIGIEMCWLDTRQWAASLYFYGPNLLILIFNIVTFTQLTIRIYKVRTDVARLSNKEKFFKENAIVILRLFLIMGVSWICDILSYGFRNFHFAEYLFFLTDFCNAIQGVLIFLCFIWKRSILKELKTIFRISEVKIGNKFGASGSSTATTTFMKLSAMQSGSTSKMSTTDLS